MFLHYFYYSASISSNTASSSASDKTLIRFQTASDISSLTYSSETWAEASMAPVIDRRVLSSELLFKLINLSYTKSKP